jgi:glycogen debranching enzyme
MLDHDLELKADEVFLVGEIQTDGSGESGKGLYLHDTRHLCTFDVRLDNERMEVLSARLHDSTLATTVLTNSWMPNVSAAPLPKHVVMVRERMELNHLLSVDFEVKNFGLRPLEMSLSIELAADFRDIFDIRGFARAKRGVIHAPVFTDSSIMLGYEGRDKLLVRTCAQFSQPSRLIATEETRELPDGTSISIPGALAVFDLDLQPEATWRLLVEILPLPVETTPLRHLLHETFCAHVETNHVVLNSIHDQSVRDLKALQTPFGDGSIPAAGIPWFVAPFGRDSLIVGLQTLHLHPEAAIQTLQFLATLQGSKVDSFTDEEPGKILHEMRYGEMARMREVPHLPYFGTVDATPLFIWLAAEVFNWTCNSDLYANLQPNVLRDIHWIDH